MKYIKGFDTLRAISIIFVITTHLGLYWKLPQNDFIQLRVWKLISGDTGVQIFFTLSGFLITSLLISEKIKRGINLKNFYIRRFLRLIPPLILFYILIGILMKLQMIRSSSTGFLFSFFYAYNFVPERFYISELGHTWSLAVEEQFYFSWPLIVILFKRNRSIILLALFFTFSCLFFVLYFKYFEFAREAFRPFRWFIPAAGPIIIGSIAALLNVEFAKHFKVFFNKNFIFLILCFALFAYPLYSLQSLLQISFLIQAVSISLLLIWIYHNQESFFVKSLNNKSLNYIGKISYGLYVYQGLFLRTGPGGNLDIQKFPLNIVLTIIIAIISYELIEKPILKFKRKFA